MTSFLLTVFQTLAVLALAPIVTGCVRFFKARLQGRHGASPFLPYVTLAALLRKQMVISESVSWMFRLAPFVVLSSAICLVLILPLVAHGAAGSYGDLFVTAGVLLIGAVFLVFGGLDAASAFGGMGASREMTIASLLEPAIIVTLATLSLATGSTNVGSMVAAGISLSSAPYLALTLAALALIALAENARYPADNPATHLELTMVHEAMVLEYSGPYLAMLEYASSLKLTVFALLLTNFLWPWSLAESWAASALVFAFIAALLKVTVVSAALALLESIIAKMRFYRLQEYLTAAFFLALGGLIIALMQYAL